MLKKLSRYALSRPTKTKEPLLLAIPRPKTENSIRAFVIENGEIGDELSVKEVPDNDEINVLFPYISRKIEIVLYEEDGTTKTPWDDFPLVSAKDV